MYIENTHIHNVYAHIHTQNRHIHIYMHIHMYTQTHAILHLFADIIPVFFNFRKQKSKMIMN